MTFPTAEYHSYIMLSMKSSREENPIWGIQQLFGSIKGSWITSSY